MTDFIDNAGSTRITASGQGKVYQNIKDSTITNNSTTYIETKIEQVIYQSLDYQALMERIVEKQEMVQYLQETGKTDRALKASAELEELEQQEEQFKQNVFRLYETFTKIEINSERLKQAKAHFDQGEFREADAILNAADMQRDLNQLIERDQQLDQEKAEIEQHRTQLANEYLIKARLWTTFYDRPNHFEQSCDYFEAALQAGRRTETGFEYAVFLQNYKRFDQAKTLYEDLLPIYRALAQENSRTYSSDVAIILNNIAVLQKTQDNRWAAECHYQEALQIYRTLAQENPRTYLPDVAMTLLNLSIFYLQATPDKEQSIALATEVLEIAQQFLQVPVVQRYAETAIQVLQVNGVEADLELNP